MSDATKSEVLRWVKHYVYACFAKGWNGAIAAVYGILGLTAGASFDPENITPPSWHTIVYIFGVAFLVSIVGFLKDNPIPPKLTDTEPPFQK